VRRFLRRLKGEEETDEHDILTSFSSMAGVPEDDPKATMQGKKGKAGLRSSDTAETETPTGLSAEEGQATGIGGKRTDEAGTVPGKVRSSEMATASAEAETPLPTQSRLHKPPLDPPRPAGSTEYSSSNLGEKTPIGAKETARMRKEDLRPQEPTPMVAHTPAEPSDTGNEAVSEESTARGAFPTSQSRDTIGKKRKISVGPPPAPEPVPSSTSQTGEDNSLSLEGVLDLIQESEQMGSDSGWDRSYPGNKSLEPVMMPSSATPAGGQDQDRERVAAAQVQTQGSPSSDGTPDREGQLGDKSPISIVFDLALAEETGMLAFQVGDTVKEVYFVDGAPQSVASNRPEELFGQYLVIKGAISEGELAMALAMVDHFNGKLGDALVALKLMRPVHVLRHLTQQVREKLLEAIAWEEGSYSFFRNRMADDGAAPVGLDSYEFLGSAVEELPKDYVDRRLVGVGESKLLAVSSPPVPPEVFRRGGRIRQICDQLDGRLTLQQMLALFDDRTEALAFARIVVLLLETGLVAAGE